MLSESKNQTLFKTFLGKELKYTQCQLNQLLPIRYLFDYALMKSPPSGYSIRHGKLVNSDIEKEFQLENAGQATDYIYEDDDLEGITALVKDSIENGFGCVRNDYYLLVAAYGILSQGALQGSEEKKQTLYFSYTNSNRYLSAKEAWHEFEERVSTKHLTFDEMNPFCITDEE